MDRTCSTHGTDEIYIQNSGKKLEGRDHSEDLGVRREYNIRMDLTETV